MSLLDILNPPVHIAAPRRAVTPLGPWPVPASPEKREAQRLRAIAGAAKRRTRKEAA